MITCLDVRAEFDPLVCDKTDVRLGSADREFEHPMFWQVFMEFPAFVLYHETLHGCNFFLFEVFFDHVLESSLSRMENLAIWRQDEHLLLIDKSALPASRKCVILVIPLVLLRPLVGSHGLEEDLEAEGVLLQHLALVDQLPGGQGALHNFPRGLHQVDRAACLRKLAFLFEPANKNVIKKSLLE